MGVAVGPTVGSGVIGGRREGHDRRRLGRLRSGLDRRGVRDEPGGQEGDAERGEQRRQESRTEAQGEVVHGARLAAALRDRPSPLVLVPSGR
jgi:hypothetical protein